jgi:predicted permease
MRRFMFRVASFFRRGRADRELTRELTAHLQLLEDGYVANGMTPADARAAARRAFGGQVEQVRLRHRDARSFRWLDDSWVDFKLGARLLVKYPGLSIVGGISMAVAIAFGTASFAFFYSYMYPTLSLPEGDRLVALENWDVSVNNEWRRAAHDFEQWREEMQTVREIGAFRNLGRNLIVPGGSVEAITAAEITAPGFAAARVPPQLGRPILAEDVRPDAPPVLVIGHDVWQSRFGGDRSVVGREVRLGATVHTIVGVMPEGFGFPMNHSYWLPLRIDASRYPRGQGPSIFIFGRLAPGVTIADAQAELAAIGTRSTAAYPATHTQLRPQVLPYTYPLVDIQDVSLWQVGVMQGMVSMLLVVVAINIAILVYARTATRQGEIAVRTALGASRARVVGQLFVEALVLAGLSAGIGLLIARFAIAQGHAIMQTEVGRMPFWLDEGIPLVTIVYVVGLTLLAAVLAGVVPGLKATRHQVQTTLRDVSTGTGLALGRTWTLLIIGQVSLAVAALPAVVATGWREVRQATSVPVFAAEQYLAARFALGEEELPPGVDPEEYRRGRMSGLARLQAELAMRVETEPWASDVSMATAVPGNEPTARVEVEDVRGQAAAGREVRRNDVAGDFFQAFDARLLTGRSLNDADTDAVIVNRTFVDRVLGGANVLGRRLRYLPSAEGPPGETAPERWYEIVGVVSDLYSNVMNPEMTNAEVYHALSTSGPTPAALLVRTRGADPSASAARLREIAIALDPTTRINTIPLVQIYRQDKLALRLVAFVLGLIVVSVLLLSAAGVYALMSFTVSRRRKEIGIRAALGADPGRLLRSVFARAAAQLAAGVLIGIATITALDMSSEGDLLTGKQAILLPAICVLMLGTGLLAAWGPARRGLAIQPTEALREE